MAVAPIRLAVRTYEGSVEEVVVHAVGVDHLEPRVQPEADEQRGERSQAPQHTYAPEGASSYLYHGGGSGEPLREEHERERDHASLLPRDVSTVGRLLQTENEVGTGQLARAR